MTGTSYPIRDQRLVWRDIAGEVVIAERDNRTVHVLNSTASQIWKLADGTRHTEDMVTELCKLFDVSAEQARADVEEFYQQLLAAGLLTENGGRL